MYGSDVTTAWHVAAPPPPPPPPSSSPGMDAGMGSMSSMPASNTVGRPLSRMATMASAALTSLRPSGQYNSRKMNPAQMELMGGCAFDKNALGDDLPASAHAPEPERPVSRNATARANARERERYRAQTLGSHSSMSLFDYNREQIEQQRLSQEQKENEHAQKQTQIKGSLPLLERAPSRLRYDSSPLVPSAWNGSSSPSMAEMSPPQMMPLHRASSQNMHAHANTFDTAPVDMYNQACVSPASPQAWPQFLAHHHTQQPQNQHVQQQQPPTSQPQYTFPSQFSPQIAGHIPTSPSTHGQSWWNAEGQIAYEHSAQQPAMWNGGQQDHGAEIPFPQKQTHIATSYMHTPASSPYLPKQQMQGWSGALGAVSDSGCSSISPSRSSSRSSTVSRAPSTLSSVSSVSGSARRALPQPPTAQRTEARPASPVTPRGVANDNRPETQFSSEADATITASTRASIGTALSKHESVRLAAEEIMARGSPRRRGMIPTTMRASGEKKETDTSVKDSGVTSKNDVPDQNHANCSSTTHSRGQTLDQSSQVHELKDTMQRVSLGACATATEYESATERFRSRMCTNHSLIANETEKSVAQKDFVSRAVSPQPRRAYPSPDPAISIASPWQEVAPSRPRSRGPKDERDQQAIPPMASMALPIPPPMPIRSPPPDKRMPEISVESGSETRAVNVPVITIGAPEEAEASSSNFIGTRSPQAYGRSSTAAAPVHHQRQMPHGFDDSHHVHSPEQTQATISISQSTTNVAQRSTSSMPGAPIGRGRYGVAPAPASALSVGSGASCTTCQRWISGRVVHAMSQTYHPECFACSHCNENLEHVAFYEHEGRAYCHFDYHELFSKRCFHCRTPIVDQRYITINDVELTGNAQGGQSQERCYHDMHFFCANCGDPFLDPKLASDAAGCDPLAETIEDESGTVRYGGRKFVVHKGYPYCEHCHVSLHKPRCKGCRHPIVDAEYLTALKGKWHVGCFCCNACKRPIEDDNFFVRDNVAYDEQCYKLKLRSEL